MEIIPVETYNPAILFAIWSKDDLLYLGESNVPLVSATNAIVRKKLDPKRDYLTIRLEPDGLKWATLAEQILTRKPKLNRKLPANDVLKTKREIWLLFSKLIRFPTFAKHWRLAEMVAIGQIGNKDYFYLGHFNQYLITNKIKFGKKT